MTGKEFDNPPVAGKGISRGTQDEQPLLRLLVAEAAHRGDSLAALAKALGVTYERLTQWRRSKLAISRARREVHERAADYLGIPVVNALVLAGVVTMSELTWPRKRPFAERVGRELERLQGDPRVGPLLPAELLSAAPAVQLFALFLIHELNAGQGDVGSTAHWQTTLMLAAAGNGDAQAALHKLRSRSVDEDRLF